jgi:CDP-diacylglycerol--glycerol-3-phosphate 3-phosphatidyltransferase
VLVGFEERNEKLFFWLGGVLFVVGSIADILDGALARAASKGTVFGAFLDSTFDRLGEAAMLTAIGLVFMRDGNEIALVATFAAVIVRSSSRTHARRPKHSASEATSGSARASSGRPHLRRARSSPMGAPPVAHLLLAATAWLTVVQRMLFVRRQLRDLAEQT